MKRWKRIISVLLVLVLLVTGVQFGAEIVNAADPIEMSITSVGSLKYQSATEVQITLTTNATFQGSGAVGGLKNLITFAGMDAIAEDATEIYGWVTKGEKDILLIFRGVSISDVSAIPEGAQLTFTPGEISAGGVAYALTNDNTLEYRDGAWVESAETIEITSVSGLKYQSATEVQITLTTDTTFQGSGSVSRITGLITFEGMDDITTKATGKYGWVTAGEKDILLIFQGVSINDVSAIPEGAKLTFTPGEISAGGVAYALTNDNTLEYRDGAWAESAETIEITSVSGLKYQSATEVQITLTTDTTFQGSGSVSGITGLITFEGMDDITTKATGKYGWVTAGEKDILLIFQGVSINDVSAIPEGAKLTFAPGAISAGGVAYALTNDNTLEYRNGQWADGAVSEVTITDVSGLENHFGHSVRMTLTTDATFPSDGSMGGLKDLITFEGMDTIVNNASETYGYALKDSGTIWLIFADISINDISAIPNGAKITFQPGTMSLGDVVYSLTNDESLTCRNGQWTDGSVSEISIASVSGLANHFGQGVRMTLTTDATFPSDGFATGLMDLITFEGMDTIVNNASEKYGYALNGSGDIWLVFADVSYNDVSGIPRDAKITFKAGTFTLGDTTYGFADELSLVHRNGIWVDENSDDFIEDESQYKRANVKVYDLFELESLSSVTILQTDAVFNLTDLKQSSNVGLRMQIDDLHGEVVFGISKEIANQVWSVAGYQIKVNTNGRKVGIYSMWATDTDFGEPKEAEATGLDIDESFVLEFGVADLYPASGGTEVVARRVYVKIDDAEVLSWIDTDMTRRMGSYVPAWTQYDIVVKSVDYEGYELCDADVNVQDISELIDGVSTFTTTPTMESVVGQTKRATNNAIRMKVKWQSPVEGETDELLINFANKSEAGIWDGAIGGYNVLFGPNFIRARHVGDAGTTTQVSYEYPKDEFILEIGLRDRDVYKDGKRIKGHSRTVYVKIDGEVVLTMADKNLERDLGTNVRVYSSQNVVADLVSLTSDRYFIRSTPVVNDLFDVSKLSKKELKSVTTERLGQLSSSTNVALKTKVTASSDCAELLFAFAKTSKEQFWDVECSGWEFWIRPSSNSIYISMHGARSMCVIGIPEEFILEVGVRDVKYNNGEFYGRELYVAIDGLEVLRHVDKDLSRAVGKYVHTYVTPAESSVTLESLTTTGYVLTEKNIRATDIYDASGYASKKLNDGLNFVGELGKEKNSAIKMHVDIDPDAEEFGLSFGKAVTDTPHEDSVDENVSGYNIWFMPLYRCIRVECGYYNVIARLSHEFKESFELEVGTRDVYYENGKYYGYELYIKVDGETIGNWIDEDIKNRKLGTYVLSYINPNAKTDDVTFSTLYPTITLPVEYVVNGEQTDEVSAISTETAVVANKPSKITITTNTMPDYIVNDEGVFLNETLLTAIEVENQASGAATYEVKAKKGDKIVLKLNRRELSGDEASTILDLYDVSGMRDYTVQGLSNGPIGQMIKDGNRQRTNSAFRFKITMPEVGCVRMGMYSDQSSPWAYTGFIVMIYSGRIGLYNSMGGAMCVVNDNSIQLGETYYLETGMVKCYEDGNYKYNRWYVKIGESLDTMEQICWYDSRERASYGSTVAFIGQDFEKTYVVESTYDVKALKDISTQENKDKLATYTVYREERPRLHYPEYVKAYKDVKSTDSPAYIKLHTKDGMKMTALRVNGVNVIDKVRVTEEGAYIYELPKVTQNINFSYTIGAIK